MVAMRKAKLLIHQDPVAKGRPKFGGKFAYTPAKTRAAETAVKYEMKAKFKDPIFDCAIKVKMYFGIPRPASVSKKKRPYPSVKSDVDNIAKLYLDCGNGTLWVDDALICTLHIEKRYAEQGFIEINIEEICD